MPKLKKREILLNKVQTRAVGVSVSRKDEADNKTLSFVFVSDDNSGVRFDWGSGDYYNEILDVNGANVSRLNTFFKDHYRNVDSAVGKVSNARVEDGQLVGDITFGTDEDSQRVFSKYSEGILTDVSIGYEIRDYKVEQGAENERDNVTVTDFDVFEVSAVGIGFDSGAKKRSDDENSDRSSEMNEELKQRLLDLEAIAKRTADETKELKKLQAQRNADEAESEKAEMVRVKAENANLKRQADITALSDKHEVSAEIRKKFMDDARLTVQDFQGAILDARAKETAGDVFVVGKGGLEVRENLKRAMVDGLALRLGTNLTDAHPDAELYRNAPLAVLANQLLAESERSFNPIEVAERSMVTGDFPLLLMTAGNRVLESEFDAQTSTYQTWVRQVDVPDFRANTDITTGQGGRLSKTLENGDLKELSVAENAETWKLGSFGNKFVLTREMIINDDLGAFTDMLSLFAQMAVTTANGLSYDILRGAGDYSGYTMADGTLVFSTTTHSNKASSPLDSASLSVGRLAMRKQKGIDGKTPLNITPKYLVVGAGLEQTAMEILGSTSKIGATNDGTLNVHYGSLELIVDAELNDTEWYLTSERRTVKVGYLAGTGRRPVLKMNDSSLIRTSFEGVFDIGLVVEDYRGLYQGNQ